MVGVGFPAGASDGPTVATNVLGVGIDVVSIERFVASLERTPSLRQRLFTAAEQRTLSGSVRSGASLAARFAVKEAVAKALGVPRGMDWHHCTVVTESSGQPRLVVTDTVAAAADAAGVTDWRLSISHDAGIAAAVVVALGAHPVTTPHVAAVTSTEAPGPAQDFAAVTSPGTPGPAPDFAAVTSPGTPEPAPDVAPAATVGVAVRPEGEQ